MKKILSSTDYLFSAGSKTIDFSPLVGFDSKRVMAVINTTYEQSLIYATGGGHASPTGGSFSGFILTLNFDTTSMADTDNLQIIYDVQAGIEDAKSTIDTTTGKFGADFNLLNSSFGGEIGSVLPSISPDNALSVAILNGGILSAPAMNVNDELIVDATQSGNVPVSVANTVSISGNVTVDNFPATQAVTGTFWQATQPVSAASLPLPSGASTSALQTSGNATLTSIDSKATSIDNKFPTQGQKVSSGSLPVVLSSDQSTINTSLPDLNITGQSAQTAVINNIIPVTASASATDASGYKSANIQVVSTGTAGTFIFEGSNDNVNFAAIPVFNQALLNGAAITTAITATASQIIYTLPIQTRYIRLRIATTITGGSIQAFTRLSQTPFAPATMLISQATAGNLNATVTGTLTGVTTVSAVTSVSSAALQAATTTDIASAAITTTTTSANVATTNIQSASFQFAVTLVSGTSPTLDIVIQETFDGTNYFDIYHLPRITATGQYYTPNLRLTGIGIRYVRTVGGTTPSFTMSGVRISRQISASLVRSYISRAIDPNTLSSTTAAFLTDGCDKIQLCASLAAGGTGTPTFKLQGSEDLSLWYDLGASTLAVAPSASGALSVSGLLPKYARAIITVAGTGTTLSQVCIKAVGN